MSVHRTILRLALPAMLLLAGGCRTVRSRGSAPLPAPTAMAPLDHAAIYGGLLKTLATLQDSDRGTPAADLVSQLSRTHADIALPNPTRTQRLSAEEIYTRYRDAVVVVGGLYKCDKCTKWHLSTATGFFVSADGVIATNHHVIAGENRVAFGVRTADGTVHAVREVLAASKDDDIALVRIDAGDTPALPLASGSIGRPVTVIGHPGRQFYSLSSGIISAYFLHGKPNERRPRLSITADFGVGASGAPVIDTEGNVIGMVATTRPVTAGHSKDDRYAQMVVKSCIPAEAILRLVD